jgi:deazaflavin-dependent oxidoreductase (nitroreductase family)
MALTIDFRQPNWQNAHRDRYIATDGQEGQYVDMSMAGAGSAVPCLILKTTGRKSGQPKVLPLIYGEDHGAYVIVASKGGAPAHPAWYLNLEADPEVAIQVGAKKLKAHAKTVEGPERQRLFDMMAKVYPPYVDYQNRTQRRIPVVVLEPEGAIDHI